MRILLARDVHIDDTRLRAEELIRYWMVVHGGVEIVKSRVPINRVLSNIGSALLACILAVRPVLPGEVSQSAENAVVSWRRASIVAADWTVEIAEELWVVQQALQYGVAVAQEAGVSQSFGLVYDVGPSGSRKRPAFANATVDDTSKACSFAYRPRGCIF